MMIGWSMLLPRSLLGLQQHSRASIRDCVNAPVVGNGAGCVGHGWERGDRRASEVRSIQNQCRKTSLRAFIPRLETVEASLLCTERSGGRKPGGRSISCRIATVEGMRYTQSPSQLPTQKTEKNPNSKKV